METIVSRIAAVTGVGAVALMTAFQYRRMEGGPNSTVGSAPPISEADRTTGAVLEATPWYVTNFMEQQSLLVYFALVSGVTAASLGTWLYRKGLRDHSSGIALALGMAGAFWSLLTLGRVL